jgi:hypothetical protein
MLPQQEQPAKREVTRFGLCRCCAPCAGPQIAIEFRSPEQFARFPQLFLAAR